MTTGLFSQYSHEEIFVIVSTPFYLLLIGGEVLLTHWQHKKFYNLKDCVVNVVFMLLNGGVDLLFRIIYLAILTWFFTHRWFEPVSSPVIYWALLFIIEDFAFYVLHYVDHHSRLFWAVHVTHHSSEYFNLTTGFRSSVFQPLYRFIYFIPIALLGFHPADIVIMYSVTQIYGIVVHTRHINKLGLLEKILVTPSHHRVHHASNVEYLDKNMGMCLIIWDKLFGTFQEELPQTPPKFGLTKPLKTENILYTLFHEWQDILKDLSLPISLRNKVNYLLKAPGWSHDGSRKTSKMLLHNKKQAKQEII